MKTTTRLSSLAAILLALATPRACINEYSQPSFTDKIGNLLGIKRTSPPPATKARPRPTPAAKINPKTRHILALIDSPPARDWSGRERELRPIASAENADFRSRNDYAATLLHLGRTKESLGILEALASQHPNEYSILATLGTAYELDGQLERALQYLSKATELNPKSHMGTEWLHVKILEAKIAMHKDPTWLESHSVLGDPFTTRKYVEEQLKISDAITYQLNERLQFVSAPDAVVADLLYDMGRLYDSNFDYASAVPLYKASLKFGNVRQTAIESRLNPDATWQSQHSRSRSSS